MYIYRNVHIKKRTYTETKSLLILSTRLATIKLIANNKIDSHVHVPVKTVVVVFLYEVSAECI